MRRRGEEACIDGSRLTVGGRSVNMIPGDRTADKRAQNRRLNNAKLCDFREV